MDAYFAQRRPEPLGRPVSVAPLLRSVRNAPPQSWVRRDWALYTKLGTLPFPDVLGGGAYQHPTTHRAVVLRPATTMPLTPDLKRSTEPLTESDN